MDSLASRFTLDTGVDLLESAEPDNEYPDLILPDFLYQAGRQLQQIRRYGAEFGTTIAGSEVHTSFCDIRAPPGLF
jgi:hypothetical protein